MSDAPAKKKSGCLGMFVAAGVMTLALGICYRELKVETAPDKGTELGRIATDEVLAQLPWLKDVESSCHAYDRAPNQIKKSEVFNANNKALAAVKMRGVKGQIKKIATNQGGGHVSLAVAVGPIHLSTSMFDPVGRGKKVYQQAADLGEGQCVIFSASQLRPASFREAGQVCDTSYVVEFTDLKACN
jgi:hypothetical protein